MVDRPDDIASERIESQEEVTDESCGRLDPSVGIEHVERVAQVFVVCSRGEVGDRRTLGLYSEYQMDRSKDFEYGECYRRQDQRVLQEDGRSVVVCRDRDS